MLPKPRGSVCGYFEKRWSEILIRALSVDDHALLREGIAALIVAMPATFPRQANCRRADCVVPDNRWSFPAIRSTTLPE
jgi:hypothetical protein